MDIGINFMWLTMGKGGPEPPAAHSSAELGGPGPLKLKLDTAMGGLPSSLRGGNPVLYIVYRFGSAGAREKSGSTRKPRARPLVKSDGSTSGFRKRPHGR